jgi:polysaccharide pyruvyl transferase WcaK-like protein
LGRASGPSDGYVKRGSSIDSRANRHESLLKPSARRKKIGLLGPFSFGNLGNAALQEVLIERFRKRFPEAEFYGCCVDLSEPIEVRQILPFPFDRHVPWPQTPMASPMSDAVSHGSRTKAKRIPEWIKKIALLSGLSDKMKMVRFNYRQIQEELAFCVKAHRFLKEFRLLVFGLGGLFDEIWKDKWGDLYSYFRWAVLARVAGTPLVCLSVGVEEVNTRLGKFFCKTVFLLAGYRSFRDVESREKAEAMGVTGDNRVFPDLAFGLETKNSLIRADRERRNFIGVSPTAYCDPRFWPIKDFSAYQGYLMTLSSFVSWLLHAGYDVVLFATQIRMDRTAIEELKAAVLKSVSPSLHTHLTDANLQNVDDCLTLLSQLDMAVTSRLHGVILSQLVGTPVLALSHASKINRLMEQMVLQQYVLNIREFDLPLLIERFKMLEANLETVRRDIQSKVGGYRKDVDAQFDLLSRTCAYLDPAR